jgi:hypothetical protein
VALIRLRSKVQILPPLKWATGVMVARRFCKPGARVQFPGVSKVIKMSKKTDERKKVKITIEVTEKDLCNLEDFLHCIPLCDKHKGMSSEPRDERELMTLYYVCDDCEKTRNKWACGAQRIESRLWRQLAKIRGWK